MTADSSQSPEDQRVTPLINWARWNVKHWIWSSLPPSLQISPSLAFSTMSLGFLLQFKLWFLTSLFGSPWVNFFFSLYTLFLFLFSMLMSLCYSYFFISVVESILSDHCLSLVWQDNLFLSSTYCFSLKNSFATISNALFRFIFPTVVPLLAV